MGGVFCFGGRVTRVKGLRCAVVASYDDRSLNEISDRGPVLMIMNSDVSPRLYREQSLPQLPSIHSSDFRTKINDCCLSNRKTLVILRGFFGDGDWSRCCDKC